RRGAGPLRAVAQSLIMAVCRQGEGRLGLRLPDDIPVEVDPDVFRGTGVRGEPVGETAAALFLGVDGLAQLVALAADVHVAGTLDQRAAAAVACPAELAPCRTAPPGAPLRPLLSLPGAGTLVGHGIPPGLIRRTRCPRPEPFGGRRPKGGGRARATCSTRIIAGRVGLRPAAPGRRPPAGRGR